MRTRLSAHEGEKHRQMRALRWVVPSLGLLALGLAVLAYRFDPPAYFRALSVLMMTPVAPPFIDAAQIPALIDCWQQGIDVYVTAPCDPGHRTMAYSPLWLRATFLPTALSWMNWLGLALGGIFFLSLGLLPAPRRPTDILLLCLATFSSMPVFALERGNMDVVMFLLIVVGGWFWARNLPVRMLGYPFITLAGLLKFYPLILFLLFLRERTAYFIALCVAAFIVLAGFVLYFQGELAEMARNLPSYGYFTDSFSFRQLPIGVGVALQGLADQTGLQDNAFVQSLDPPHSVLLILDVFALLVIATLAIAFRLATRAGFQSALAALAPDEMGFLIIGAALICGCFFAGQNVSYRGIHFLFVMPAIIALATTPSAYPLRTLFRVTAIVILLVMWGLTLQQLVAWLSGGSPRPMEGSIAIYLYWIAHELAWWWIVSVLLAVLICFVAQSPVWHALATFRHRSS